MKTNKLLGKLSKGDSTFDIIMAHHIDPIKYPLTDKQEEIRARWAEVFALRLNYFSRIQVANKLVEDRGISMAQAYIDIKNSEHLYGNVLKADKEGNRAVLFEYAHKFYQRAIQQKDLKAQAKGLELLAEFGGIRDTENLEFNPEKLENKELHLVIPKEQLEALKQLVSNGVVDFNKLNVTDVNYQDVTTK